MAKVLPPVVFCRMNKKDLGLQISRLTQIVGD